MGREKNFIVSVPYNSLSSVIDFLQEAGVKVKKGELERLVALDVPLKIPDTECASRVNGQESK